MGREGMGYLGTEREDMRYPIFDMESLTRYARDEKCRV